MADHTLKKVIKLAPWRRQHLKLDSEELREMSTQVLERELSEQRTACLMGLRSSKEPSVSEQDLGREKAEC